MSGLYAAVSSPLNFYFHFNTCKQENPDQRLFGSRLFWSDLNSVPETVADLGWMYYRRFHRTRFLSLLPFSYTFITNKWKSKASASLFLGCSDLSCDVHGVQEIHHNIHKIADWWRLMSPDDGEGLTFPIIALNEWCASISVTNQNRNTGGRGTVSVVNI